MESPKEMLVPDASGAPDAAGSPRGPAHGEFIRGLRGALPYLEDYYNETFVIKISGEALSVDTLPGILDDLILLHSVGIKIVVVSGARDQIMRAVARAGGEAWVRDGRMEVGEAWLPVAFDAAAAANWELITRLSGYGREIFPLSGHFVQAQKKEAAEAGQAARVGDVAGINTRMLESALANQGLPVIPPLGIGPRGAQYLIDANQVAVEAAVRLRARKLIMLSCRGHWDHAQPGGRAMTSADLRAWLRDNPGGDPIVAAHYGAMAEACERGVERCHHLDARFDGALLGEVLTPIGAGLMVTNSSYHHLRPATYADLHAIRALLEAPIREMVLVHKDYRYMERHIENYIVYCVDEEVVGCLELVFHRDSKAVEVASFAVRPDFRNRGIGKKLLGAAQERARKDGVRAIFALTTQAGRLFQDAGYQPADPDQLPPAKRANYDSELSRIFSRAP